MKSETTVDVTLHIEEGVDEPLRVVRGIREGLRNLDSVLRDWVSRAREQGCSWQQIADALDVTRQSAWERFKEVDQHPDDIIESVIGSLDEYPGPSTDEMRRLAKEEGAELERRSKTP